jgi:hypothetical protein
MDVVDYYKCGRCDSWQPPEHFGFRDRAQTKRQQWCLTCLVAYKRDRYQRNRSAHKEHVRVSTRALNVANKTRLRAFKAEHPCVDCGESDPVVLEFDHLRDKRWNISHMATGNFPWITIESELVKCEVRCANCHRRKTLAGLNGRDYQISEEVGPYLFADN